MSAAELDLVERVKQQYSTLRPIPCTGCEYCQPCPHGVVIPEIFSIYNNAVMYDSMWMERRRYFHLAAESRADRCQECGDCERICPQQIEIIAWLKRAHSALLPAAA
jgi:uncharacterized protein